LLQSVKPLKATLICYEAPRRIVERLQDMLPILGNREVVLARELTKHYEEILRLPMQQMIENLSARDTIKGEAVLLIAGASASELALSQSDIDALLQNALQHHSTKEAAQKVAQQSGLAKSMLYQRALQLKP
jgi:16S rRNA (cytidine1402-2'-O)-methyltransferase